MSIPIRLYVLLDVCVKCTKSFALRPANPVKRHVGYASNPTKKQ